jgi:hypothetical protein
MNVFVVVLLLGCKGELSGCVGTQPFPREDHPDLKQNVHEKAKVQFHP